MNKTHSGKYPECEYPKCVSFILWEKLLLYNFVSGSTDLYESLVANKKAHRLKYKFYMFARA